MLAGSDRGQANGKEREAGRLAASFLTRLEDRVVL
jgi:hypothetical protein